MKIKDNFECGASLCNVVLTLPEEAQRDAQSILGVLSSAILRKPYPIHLSSHLKAHHPS